MESKKKKRKIGASDGWKMKTIWSICTTVKFSLSQENSFRHNMENMLKQVIKFLTRQKTK